MYYFFLYQVELFFLFIINFSYDLHFVDSNFNKLSWSFHIPMESLEGKFIKAQGIGK